MTGMALARFEADVGFADDGVEDYDEEPGGARLGVSGGIGGSVGGEFDVSQLPPPPNVPPPPVPEFQAEGGFGEEGGEIEGGGEKRKKKKKHREREGEGEDENGERRHRRKKKKHREGGEGEDGERPRRHRRHRREAADDAPDSEIASPGLSVNLNPGEIDGTGVVQPPEQDLNYSVEAPNVPGIGYEAQPQYDYEQPPFAGGDVEANVQLPTNPSPDPELSIGVGHQSPRGLTEETWSRGSPSVGHDSPRVIVDPVAVDANPPSVEDYYYRASPQNYRYPTYHQTYVPPPQFSAPISRNWQRAGVTVGEPEVDFAAPDVRHAVPDVDPGLELPQANVGFESPQANVGFESPHADVGFESPQANVGFEAPQADVGFEAPQANVGFEAPHADVGFEAPHADVGFEGPQADVGFESPVMQPVTVGGVMALPPDGDMNVPPSDMEPIHVNGDVGYQGDLQVHGGGGYMPGEPVDDQQMYTVNQDMYMNEPQVSMGAPQFSMEAEQPKPKGLSKIFGFRKSLGKGPKKKKREPELQVSGPMISGPNDQLAGPYAPSPIIGSPDSTMRSGQIQQDPWQSNPQLFNPNIDTLDPQMGNRGTLDQQGQLGGRGGKQGKKKLPSTRPIPVNRARVILLDGEEIEVDVDKRGLGREVFERVCDHLSIEERDYFGLTYANRKEQAWFWLDVEKKVSKQLKHGEDWLFNFQVKFYPPEPSLIQEDITRYQLTLQVRQDIFTGKLPCSWVTQALMGSFLVQSELGDYDPDDHQGIDYLRQFEFVQNQNDQLLSKIAELHKNHKGMTPDQADLKYLETAKRLEQYGYDLHPARDMDDVDIFIGVSFSGVVVYRGPLRISRFAWPKVLRISYRKNFFYLKIRSECYDDFEAIVGFKLFNNKLAKRLWKIAVEHHTFFRLKEPRFAPKTNVVPRFGSRYRYSGRTFFQYRTMSIDRPHPNFDRSLTKRRTASMPMLAGGGSQYGSMHSLSRPHPRALTMNKVQSVEYLGPSVPRTPNMGARSGSMEFSGSMGGSIQNLPASTGNRVLVGGGGGMPMAMRGGGSLTPQSQRQGSLSAESPGQAPRVQYHQRVQRPPDQVSITGSEVSAGARAGGVPLPYANVNMPQARMRASIGSADEDLL